MSLNGRRGNTYFSNESWYTVWIHWRNRDNTRGEYALTGLGGTYTLGYDSYDVYVTGPGGTHFPIQDGNNYTYRWYGGYGDQKVSGPGYDYEPPAGGK